MKKIIELAKENKMCKMCDGKLCTNYCRDCVHMDLDNAPYGDGTRRCSYKGQWLKPSTPACAYFKYY